MNKHVEAERVSSQDMNTTQSTQAFDTIIIGAGLGGLLSAAQLLERGKRVLVVERLPHCGGRFTAKTFQGVQVSTGAVHMVPFGSSGVLSQMLQRLHVPHYFFDADVFGSFHVDGKQYQARGILGVFKFLGSRQFALLVSLGYQMFVRTLPQNERTLPYSVWLEQHIDIAKNPQLVAFFERVSRFALSLELCQVSTAEVVEITKNMFRYGAPAIVRGGCGGLTQALEQHIRAHGASIQLSREVLQILHENGRVTGVRVREKASGYESVLTAPVIVSDIGPRATEGLLQNQKVTQAQVLKQQATYVNDVEVVSELYEARGSLSPIHEAVGLKIHILSDVSLIPHKGIMYCLDTQRIAGMVQPTNSDPLLAPPGKHLLISHQVIQSNNVEEERALALADLRMLFGEAFDKHCRILTMGTYRGEWPVNRMAQGEDAHAETTTQGLYLVGDAVKPTGYLMVEGVAQSVNRFLDVLDENGQEHTRQRYVLPPPPRLHALRWLFRAPGNAKKNRNVRKH
ncbi:MAG: NAD(P)/FAD-dependent oxidoreductase [Ktedonobacteraceae bacterium]